MAAAQVVTDLFTISGNDNSTDAGFFDITGSGGQGSSPTENTELFIQGSGSVGRRVSATIAGLQYDAVAGSVTGAPFDLTDGRHVFVWSNNLAGGGTETVQNGGMRVILADGTTNNNNPPDTYSYYYVDGNNFTQTIGGWRCFVVDPNQTPAVDGSLNETSVVSFGMVANQTSSVANVQQLLVDAIRIGTGLTVYNGESGSPASISSITSVNDTTTNQYGVFTRTDTGANIQGKLDIGFDDASTTETYFQDSNKVIVNINKNPLSEETTPFYNTGIDFTGIKVQGGLTTCILENVTFVSADSRDKGYFDCGSATNDPALVTLNGCSFLDWGSTTLSGNTSITNTTWIGCELITLNSGTLDNCTVETGVGGTYVFAGANPDNISNTSFIGVNTTDTSATGYGHAIEITSSGTYNFVNNSFVGFDTTGSDGAALNINGSGINVTLNISGNDATASPTYKLSNGANDPTINAAVTVNVTGLPVVGPTEDATEIRVLLAGQDLFATATGIGTTSAEDAQATGVGTESHRTATYSFSITKNIDIDLRIINLDYTPQFISSITTSNDPTNIASNMKLDRVSQNDKQ